MSKADVIEVEALDETEVFLQPLPRHIVPVERIRLTAVYTVEFYRLSVEEESAVPLVRRLADLDHAKPELETRRLPAPPIPLDRDYKGVEVRFLGAPQRRM